MLFEGTIYLKTNSFKIDLIKSKYHEVVTSEYGYIGVKSENRLKSLTDTYVGAFHTGLKITEAELLSSLSHEDSASFFLSLLRGKIHTNNIGAAAFFDLEKRELVLYRDVFGRVPVFYSIIDDSTVFFSTSFASLATTHDIKRRARPNARRIAGFNTFYGDSTTLYEGETFLNNVKAVLPGHMVRISLNSVETAPAIEFQLSKWSQLTTLPEFGEAFRSTFLDAVRRSDKGARERFASHLSGGLDSSSVSTAVRFLYPDHPLLTIYHKSNIVEHDEILYSRAVAEAIGSEHHEMSQMQNDFELLQKYTQIAATPSNAFPGPAVIWSLMTLGQSNNCDTIFNGHAGDSVVGNGMEVLDRSFKNQDWDTFKSLIGKRAAYSGHASLYNKWADFSADKKFGIILHNYLFKQLARKLSHSSLKEFADFFGLITKHFDVSYSYLLRRGFQSLLNKAKRKESHQIMSVLSDEILSQRRPSSAKASLLGLLGSSADQPEYRESLKSVLHTQAISSNEQNFVISKHFGIANSSPFLNYELFELCMATPDIIKFGDGIGRAHFREGMKGLLLEKVRSRSTKTPMGSHGQDVVMRLYRQSSQFLNDSKLIWDFVDRKKFSHQVAVLTNEKIPYNQKVATRFHISRTISLAVWLEAFIASDSSTTIS